MTEQRVEDLVLLGCEPALEVLRDPLLVGRALAFDRALELRLQLLLDAGQLRLRGLELGQVPDRRLVDDADVGDVGGEHLRRQREHERCDRGSGDERGAEPRGPSRRLSWRFHDALVPSAP